MEIVQDARGNMKQSMRFDGGGCKKVPCVFCFLRDKFNSQTDARRCAVLVRWMEGTRRCAFLACIVGQDTLAAALIPKLIGM